MSMVLVVLEGAEEWLKVSNSFISELFSNEEEHWRSTECLQCRGKARILNIARSMLQSTCMMLHDVY